MKVHSVGYRTDLMLAGFDGEVIHRDDYVAVVTPSSPHFWWGNFVLFDEAPGPGDLPRWLEIYQREVGSRAQVRHINLAWDCVAGEEGHAAAFIEKGFHRERSVYLGAASVHPTSRMNTEVTVRPLTDDFEWARALENQLLCGLPDDQGSQFETFMRDQFKRYRSFVDRGKGVWYGAFHDRQMVAGMGLFVSDGVARGQAVATIPQFRRRGICRTLIHEACRDGFDRLGAERIVLFANPRAPAISIYESLGFDRIETVVSLSRRERVPTPSAR